MINLNPTLTQAGLALFSGQSPGFNVVITHIAFGGSKYDPSGYETALKSELARFPIDGSALISPSSIQVGVLMTNAAPGGKSANDKWIGEIGFYAGNTLFAVLSQAAAYLFYKSPDIDIPVTYVLDFSALPPGSITVNNDALSASIALASSYAQTAAKTALDVQKYITSSYYGAAAVAPTSRPDGTARQKGDRYFDTAANAERTWTGAAWGIQNPDMAALASPAGASTIGFAADAGAVPRSVADKLQDSVNVADYAQFGGANDTAAVQKAINKAIEKGLIYVRLDEDCYCPDALENRSRVVFIGAGSLTGDGAYRRQVERDNDPATAPKFGGVVPHLHLKNFSSARKPKVVLTGSSTGTWSPNAIDSVSALPHLLQTRLAQYNQNKSISFYNRAIGGQTFGALNSVPSSFPAWYADRAKPWLDYIKDLAPDAVFIVMGSNDSSSMSHATLAAVVGKIKAFPKVPDIVFITQPSVCLDPHTAFASYGTKAAQEGRDYAAGMVRSFALYEGYGLIDGNRMGGIVLDGRDILDTAERRVLTDQALPEGGFIAAVPCHDFALRVLFEGDLAAIEAAFSNAERPVSVRLGAGGSGRSGDVAFIKRSATGKFEFVLWSNGLGAQYETVKTDIDFPTASFSLDVAKIGNSLIVSVAGQEDTARMVIPVKIYGGEFLPRIGYHEGAGGTGPFVTLQHFNVGEPRRYVPTLTGVQAWGTPNSGAKTQLPYGGNGVNHFSSLGTRAIYSPLLDVESLTAAHSGFGKYMPTHTSLSVLVASATPFECRWVRVGSFVTVTGKLALTATGPGLVALDMSLPLPTNMKTVEDLAGVINATTLGNASGSFYGNQSLNMARLQLSVVSAEPQNYRFSFTYEII